MCSRLSADRNTDRHEEENNRAVFPAEAFSHARGGLPSFEEDCRNHRETVPGQASAYLRGRSQTDQLALRFRVSLLWIRQHKEEQKTQGGHADLQVSRLRKKVQPAHQHGDRFQKDSSFRMDQIPVPRRPALECVCVIPGQEKLPFHGQILDEEGLLRHKGLSEGNRAPKPFWIDKTFLSRQHSELSHGRKRGNTPGAIARQDLNRDEQEAFGHGCDRTGQAVEVAGTGGDGRTCYRGLAMKSKKILRYRTVMGSKTSKKRKRG